MERAGFGNGARTNSLGPTLANRDYADPVNAALLPKLQIESIFGLGSKDTNYAIESRISKSDDQVRVTNATSVGTHYTTLLRTLEHRHTRESNVVAQEILSGFEIVSNRNGYVSAEKAQVTLSFNRLNELVDPGTGRLSVRFYNGAKNESSMLQPGISEPKLNKHFREERDSSGNVIKTTELRNSGPNCRVPYSGRSECTYVLKDKAIARTLGAKGDSVALAVTIDEETKRDSNRKVRARLLNFDIRLQDLDGRNLAIVEQEATLNPAGILQTVSTRARRSK